MKKPLRNEKERFLILSKGQLIGWGSEDVKNLVANANRALREKLDLKDEITVRNAECIFALEWFEQIENGINKEIVSKLNSRIGHVRYHHVLVYEPKKLPHWRRIANGDQIHEPELSVAYGVAQLLAVGALEGLKRCRLRTCREFFVGRPDAKWCSKTCGSKHRVRQKRKRDRA